jgi:hypothetical protein
MGLSTCGAYATEIWDLSSQNGNLGPSTVYMSSPGGIPVVATGFASNNTPLALFGKNDMTEGDVGGLGLVGATPAEPNEITPGEFVQFAIPPAVQEAGFTFAAGSETANETWALYTSNTFGTLGTLVASGATQFPAEATIDTTGVSFVDVGSLAGGILARQLDAPSPSAPVREPGALMILAGALVLSGGLSKMRHHTR